VLTSISVNKPITKNLNRKEAETMNNNQTKTINGIKAYYKAGVWYADYTQYQQIKRYQGIQTSIDAFCSWCDHWDLCPQG